MKYFDLHCDTITGCAVEGKQLYQNDMHISLERAEKYKPWVQVFAIWISDDSRGDAAVRRFDDIYATFCREMEQNRDSITFCRSGADIAKALADGKNAALLSIEGGAALAGRIDRLYQAYDKGVRIINLTWNGRCELGDGCMEQNAGGLTPFGREVVRGMAELGMAVDVSHLSERGFYDVAQETDAAFIASHSNTKAHCPHPRNLTDEQIREIIRRGGLIGLNFYRSFIRDGGEVGIAGLLPHAAHILSLGGEKVLAIGSDFDGSDMPDDVKGIEDVSKLYQLFSQSYNKTVTDSIFFGNAADFFTKL